MSFIANGLRSITRLAVFVLLTAGIVTFDRPQTCLAQQKHASKSIIETATVEAPANQSRTNALAKLLTNSRWQGQFTTVNENGRAGKANEETYEITKAEKLPQQNLWLLTTRIKYGKRDVTVPLPIDILWAGETPVITVDQLLIPGLGTFDARVLIRGNKYSGTWTHNDHGGHLFGTIQKMKGKLELQPAAE